MDTLTGQLPTDDVVAATSAPQPKQKIGPAATKKAKVATVDAWRWYEHPLTTKKIAILSQVAQPRDGVYTKKRKEKHHAILEGFARRYLPLR